jgi:RNA polymerase sigma-70 factor, ECF subfamily
VIEAMKTRAWGEMSSFLAARFPTLPLSKEKEAAEPIYNDTTAVGQVGEPSDESLLLQISTGDREALAILFRRYARLVRSVAERIVRNQAEADDLLQDIFLLIQRRAAAFDSSKGTARSLIVHMTYQRALSRRRYLNARHYQAPKEVEENAAKVVAPAAPLYDESIEAHFGRERLRKALDEMSEEQRETLRLYFFEGNSLSEIATLLGQTVGNVRHHYFRGLDRLRKYMPRRGSDECLVASARQEQETKQHHNSTTTTKRPSPDRPVGRFPTGKRGDGSGKTQRQPPRPEQLQRQRQLLGALCVPEYFTWSRSRRVPGGSL